MKQGDNQQLVHYFAQSSLYAANYRMESFCVLQRGPLNWRNIRALLQWNRWASVRQANTAEQNWVVAALPAVGNCSWQRCIKTYFFGKCWMLHTAHKEQLAMLLMSNLRTLQDLIAFVTNVVNIMK